MICEACKKAQDENVHSYEMLTGPTIRVQACSEHFWEMHEQLWFYQTFSKKIESIDQRLSEIIGLLAKQS